MCECSVGIRAGFWHSFAEGDAKNGMLELKKTARWGGFSLSHVCCFPNVNYAAT